MPYKIRDSYFEWLLDYIKPVRNYRKMLRVLFDVDFISIIPMDENRIQDGNCLRYEYIRGKQYQNYYISYLGEHGCSVLEMMIALSIRMGNELMLGSELVDGPHDFFWTMIDNLGLSDQTDENFDENYISFVILRLIDRKYSSDGHGGLFLSENNKDNRNIEIWYQAQAYMIRLLRERGQI